MTEMEPFPDLRAKPFRLRRPAKHTLHGDQLVSDEEHKLKNFADILGCEFFQARDDVIAEMSALLNNRDYRAKLGKVGSNFMEKFDVLGDKERILALELAKVAMNHLIDRVAQQIDGDVRNYPGEYWIEFDLRAVVYKIQSVGPSGPKLKKVMTQPMTRDAAATFGGSYGRWLNRFGLGESANDA